MFVSVWNIYVVRAGKQTTVSLYMQVIEMKTWFGRKVISQFIATAICFLITVAFSIIKVQKNRNALV